MTLWDIDEEQRHIPVVKYHLKGGHGDFPKHIADLTGGYTTERGEWILAFQKSNFQTLLGTK